MSEMVDKAMQAAAAYASTLPPGSADAPFIYSHREGLVRAIIAAMREPTEAMKQIGTHALYDLEKPEPLCAIVYTAMLDEALK